MVGDEQGTSLLTPAHHVFYEQQQEPHPKADPMPTDQHTTTVKYNPASQLPHEVHQDGHLVTRFGSKDMAEAFADHERQQAKAAR